MYTELDHQWMQQALSLAKKALFISNPNPRVGCVLVKENQIIGEGYTQVAGSHHAEIMAILDAKAKGHDVKDSTAYVTLEPCCHHGKTPPCTQSLIENGIKQVIAAMTDPNPQVAGQGLETLRNAGIEVRCGLLEVQARELNPGFIRRMTLGLPWVRMKIAASLDGTTALSNGVSQWITSDEARLDGHRWRAQSCCILTGIGTVKEDDPRMNVRGIDTPRQPLKVLIDSFLEVPLSSKILDSSQAGNTVVICGQVNEAHLHHQQEKLREMNIPIIQLQETSGQGKVDLKALMTYLAQKMHINEVHVEAGYKLNGSLLRENCVDELLIYLAPRLLGEGLGMANLPILNSLGESQTSNWQFIEHCQVGDDLRVRLIKKSNL